MSAMIISIIALFATLIYAPFYMIISPFLPPETPEAPYIPEVKTITIEGAEYKNCFLDENLSFVEKPDFNKEAPDYITSLSEYYKLENNWLYDNASTNSEKDLTEKLYCPEEDWEELKAYYSDPENYYYQYKATPRYVSEDTYVDGVIPQHGQLFVPVTLKQMQLQLGMAGRNFFQDIGHPLHQYTQIAADSQRSDDGTVDLANHALQLVLLRQNLLTDQIDPVARLRQSNAFFTPVQQLKAEFLL